MQFNVIDYIFIAILFLSAVSGFRQGFFAALGRMTGTILSLGLTYFYGKDFLLYLDHKFDLVHNLAEYISQRVPVFAASQQPGLLSFIFDPENIKALTEQIANFLLEPAVYIVLFFIIYLLFTIFFLSLNSLASRGGLKGLNRLLGMGLVILQNLFIIVILLGIIASPLELAARLDIMGAAALEHYLQGSYLAHYFADVFENIKVLAGKWA